MKKLLLPLLILLSIRNNAQTIKTASGFPDCPIGYCPSVSVSVGINSFHKPRTDCTSGFGLCLQLTLNTACNPCGSKTSINGDKAIVWTKTTDQYAEVHIPVAIKFQKGFEKTDFSKFEIDDNTLFLKSSTGNVKAVKAGIYPVFQNGDEFVFNLNLM